ncbi:MAG: serine hydrolase domain-containing protein, partial [Promethearchaeota archaeon]
DYAVDSVMVVRHGYVVLEEYLSVYTETSLHTLQSVTKSIASILMGIAIHQGYITSVSERVVDFFPDLTIANMDERKEQLTLEHLLTMTTGFDWDEWTYGYDDIEHNNLAAMHASPDAVQYVLDRPMAYEPGEMWVYCSGASILLGEIVERATGQDLNAFARANLFDPLGIGPVVWYRAPGGYYHTGGGLFMTSRDMARIGYLMLNHGTWEGSQTILSPEYAATSTANLVQLPVSNDFGYGFQWWYFLDFDIYFANGYYDQKIFVDPSRDLVVVFTCSIADGDYYPANYLFLNYILPAIDDYTPTSNPFALLLPALVITATLAIVIGITGFFWLRRRGIPTSKNP